MSQRIRMRVNGVERAAEVPDHLLLVDFLRDELELTGAKTGCHHGVCGTCTVLLDGEAVKSCVVLAVQADGCDVLTVEGLAVAGMLHPVQAAFITEGGLQCGFCTPGMVMAAVALLRENPDPTEAEVREGLSGNLCRCTGYTRIVQAVQSAAATMRVRSNLGEGAV